jgi:hypothetical protein
VLADGVGVYYRLNEAANAVSAVDTSTTGATNRHNATYVGGTKGQAGATTDGDSAVKNPNLAASFSNENEHSVEFWIRDAATDDIGNLITHGNLTGTTDGWQLYRFRDLDNVVRLAIVLKDQDVVLPCAAPSGTTWQMYVITWSGSTVTCYLNGTSAGSVTTLRTIVGAPTAAAPQFTVQTPAVLDEVALYSATLSAARVRAHYDAGLIPFLLAAPSVSGNPIPGERLSSSQGSWRGDSISYAVQWQRCAGSACSAISGATAPDYSVTTDDIGSTLRTVVTATNGHGSVSGTSGVTSTVANLMPCTGQTDPPNFDVYSVGSNFEGLPRVDLSRDCGVPAQSALALGFVRMNSVSLVYGDCTDYTDGVCDPPLEIQIWPACERNQTSYEDDPEGNPPASVSLTVRGASARWYDNYARLEVYTGDVTVVIFGRVQQQMAEAAQAMMLTGSANAMTTPDDNVYSASSGPPLKPTNPGSLTGSLLCNATL